MKKGLLYYCLAFSALFHLLIVLGVRLENFENKAKEPLVVDVVGPLKWGQKTVLPEGPKPPETKTAALKPPERQTQERPPRQFRPSFPSIPVPASPPVPAQKAPPPAAGLPSAPDSIPSPATPGQGGTEKTVSPAPQPRQAAEPSEPRRLVMPSQADLERYAKADTGQPRELRGDESVTLDTDDLMLTSYMQGLKRRIELIWKYPETARRDGLQGSLVMRFSIGKSGKLENIELLKSSGYPMLDEAAAKALMDANPFNPLPGGWKKESFTITGTFVYKLYGLYLY